MTGSRNQPGSGASGAGTTRPPGRPTLPDIGLTPLLNAVRDAGGRAVVVGGFVRDALIGRASQDLDVEIYGLSSQQTEAVLAQFGNVMHVGRAFGVMRVKGYDVDFSLPHRSGLLPDAEPDVTPSPPAAAGDSDVDFATACRRRDLSINSIGWDPIDDRWLDPLGGQADLERGLLRACDAATFGEDPLRGLRVARFIGSLGFEPDAELRSLCAQLDLDSVAPERVYDELRKLLLESEAPSRGLSFLRETGLVRFFPELAAMIDLPQDPAWHPEGCVFTHTLMVVDEAAALRAGNEDDDLALMLGALCHDFGKPTTTTRAEDGRVRSLGHDRAGLVPCESFLERLRAPARLRRRVAALVAHHLAPAVLDQLGATAKAYRKLARRLATDDVTMELLARVARADHLGRTTADALAGDCGPIDRFLNRTRELEIIVAGPEDVVQGRHVLARGISPGPEVGRVLARCREVQDAQGLRSSQAILNRVLGPGSEDKV